METHLKLDKLGEVSLYSASVLVPSVCSKNFDPFD